MIQKLAGKRIVILGIMAVLLLLAGVFFFRTTAYGFYAVLKTSLFFFVLVFLYVLLTRGGRAVFRWAKVHRGRLIRVLLLEAALLFYMVFFVHKIKNELSLYHSAQMTLGILVMELIAITFLLLEWKQVPIHRIYLILGVSLGVMFLFMQPVGTIPDEKGHLYTAYDVSNTMMGISRTPDGNVQMRSDDAAFRVRNTANRQMTALYWEKIDDPVQHEELLDTGRGTLDTQKYQYLLPAVGLTIGRLLHFGAAGTFFLGRLFNMLWFVLITAYAIKCLPFGKIVLTTVALMPMTLQQASSFSYDVFVNSTAFLLVAMTLRLAYEEEYAGGNAKRAGIRHGIHMAILLAACVLMVPLKGYAYAPLCFLPLLLVFKKWKESRKEALVYLGMILVIIVVFVFQRVFPMLHYVSSTPGTTAVSSGKQTYSLGYLRSLPYEWAYVLFNTSRNHGAFYLESMIGSPLGWLEKPLNTVLIYADVIILVFASLRRKGEEQIIGKRAKYWIQFVSWISVAFVFLGMLFAYSDVREHVIEGVQGRYFIPLAFPMLLTVRSPKIMAEKTIDGPLLSAALTIVFLVVQYLVP